MRRELGFSIALGWLLVACGGGAPEPVSDSKSSDSAAGSSDSPGSSSATTPTGNASQPNKLTRVPLSQAEVDAYRRDMVRMFMKPAKPKVSIGPDGTMIAPTDGHTNAVVATVTEDGKLEQSCVNDSEEALRFLTHSRTARR